MHIHSSWNSDRVAACCISKPRETAAVRRPVRMYTEFRGSALTVKTYRGGVKFAHLYEADVIGARLSANELVVELERSGGSFITPGRRKSPSRSGSGVPRRTPWTLLRRRF